MYLLIVTYRDCEERRTQEESNMDDLISRQAAIDADELIKQACRSTEWSHGEHPMAVEVDDIDNAEVFNSVTTQHGQWELQEEEPHYCVCSCCHRLATYPSPYCPECGAKMDRLIAKF